LILRAGPPRSSGPLLRFPAARAPLRFACTIDTHLFTFECNGEVTQDQHFTSTANPRHASVPPHLSTSALWSTEFDQVCLLRRGRHLFAASRFPLHLLASIVLVRPCITYPITGSSYLRAPHLGGLEVILFSFLCRIVRRRPPCVSPAARLLVTISRWSGPRSCRPSRTATGVSFSFPFSPPAALPCLAVRQRPLRT